MKFPLWLLLVFGLATPVRAEWFTDTQSAMGTEIRVTLWMDTATKARAAIAGVMAEMQRIDRTLSPWIESSDLARLNATAAQRPYPLSAEFAYLIDRSLYYSRISEGAFDITFASVGWFYDYRSHKKPDAETRDRLLPAINYRWLTLDASVPSLAFAHKNVRIDLGGIAKGYAVDRAIELLAARGVTQATISAGGDSRVLGSKQGSPWIVGIKNPRQQPDDEREVVLNLPLVDTAISTSGDYERFFIDEQTGERVHHILNPQTGRSAREVMSVTVLGPRAIDTDALSTTLFVLGPEKGMNLINRLDAFDAIIIDAKGQVRYSDGLTTPDRK